MGTWRGKIRCIKRRLWYRRIFTISERGYETSKLYLTEKIRNKYISANKTKYREQKNKNEVNYFSWKGWCFLCL